MSFIIPPSSSRKGSSSSQGKSKTYAYKRPVASSPSSRSAPTTSSNFFGFGGGTTSGNTTRGVGSTSYYKRRPRDGYIARLVAKIRRLLADLYRYVRKNPVKVLLPLAMALVSGGALHNLARGVGISLPEGLKHLVGLGDAAQSVRGGYDAWYGSQARRQPDYGAFGGGGGGGGAGGWLSSGLKVASAFM